MLDIKNLTCYDRKKGGVNVMTNQNKSVWFYGNNKEIIQSQAFKEKVTCNKKLNQIIDEYRSKKEKKEV